MKGTINIDLKNERRGRIIAFIAAILAIIASLIGGFFAGRKTIDANIDTEPIYLPGDTVRIEIQVPTPVYIVKPVDTANIIEKCVKDGIYAELFPEKVRDSLVFAPTAEDTLAIVRDWAAERYYEEKILDVDTLGVATVKAKTQYNRITEMTAEIIPAVKTVPYVVPPKKYEPFIGLGATTYPSVMFEVGSFVDGKWGGALMFQKEIKTKQKAFGVAIIRKF